MMPLVLMDIGSTYTKAMLVDGHSGAIHSRAQRPTTVNDISHGVESVLHELRSSVDHSTWQQTKKLACSSAAGGLKMVAVGLVPDLTAKAAQQAALGAGARVQSCFSYELTDADVEAIAGLQPDMILLAGGTDGGNQAVLLQNAQMLTRCDLSIPLVLAGNRSAAQKASDILSRQFDVHVCGNVMPEIGTLNVDPARQCIRRIFLDTIIDAKGFHSAQEQLDGLVMPTPAAVLQAGHYLRKLVGDCLIVDLGGATTDVHSFCSGRPSSDTVMLRGLPEPFAKRTVEGDLGLRVSAESLAAVIGIPSLAAAAEVGAAEVAAWLERIKGQPELVAADELEARIDQAMACSAVKLAVQRHAGRLEQMFTPSGAVWVQEGKDLTSVKTVILAGGFFAYGGWESGTFDHLFVGDKDLALLPRSPSTILDAHYVLAAAGLAAEVDPSVTETVLRCQLLDGENWEANG